MINKILNLYRKKMYSPERYGRYLGVKIGVNCSIRTKEFGSEPYLIEIGDRTEIASRVRFYNHGAAWMLRRIDSNADFFGKIFIGNDVYIGENVLIMPGVTINNNVIIAAGSVVTKSVLENSIVGGNPAKVIGETSKFVEKHIKYNVSTKKMSYQEKKKHLLGLSNEIFLKK